MDNYSCKHRFQTFLRNEKIPYQTFSDLLQIGHISITFRPEEEKIIFRDNRVSEITYVTSYSDHLILLKKYLRFLTMISAFIPAYKNFNR